MRRVPESFIKYIPPQKCPRCGKEFYRYWFAWRGKRIYVYALHGRKKCYLGPADRYRYVSGLHDGLWYEGIHNSRWLYNHVNDLVDRLLASALVPLGLAVFDEKANAWIIDSEAAKDLADKLCKLADKIEAEIAEYKTFQLNSGGGGA